MVTIPDVSGRRRTGAYSTGRLRAARTFVPDDPTIRPSVLQGIPLHGGDGAREGIRGFAAPIRAAR